MRLFTIVITTAMLFIASTAVAAPVKSDEAANGVAFTNDGIVIPSTSEYIQDGLVAMWDAIENVGYGEHDGTTTVWKDLVGTADMTLQSKGATYSWLDDGFMVSTEETTTEYFIAATTDSVLRRLIDNADAITLELVGKRQELGTINDRWFMCQGRAVYFQIIGTTPSVHQRMSFGWYTDTNSHIATFWSPASLADWTCSFVQIRTGGVEGYWDGSKVVQTSGVMDSTGCYRLSILNRGNARVYRNIRLYNRPLTADEIRYNHLVDKIRFGL